MKKLLLIILTILSINVNAQPWTSNSMCDFTSGVQWNNGGSASCACTWYSVEGTDTILNCAYGDCGQSDLYECLYDCNGHNGNPTNSVPRECDASATPICWYQGAGNTAGVDFCNGVTLPIELLEFWGQATENYNEIHWQTVTEKDNDYFIVSYSPNGLDFKELIRVDGAGTTSSPQSYSFRHGNALFGVSYYKLKQVDYNGDSEEFPVIAINNNIINSPYLFSDVYPNPSSDIFYFNYTGKMFNIPLNVKITDILGNVLIHGLIDNFNNTQAIPFKLIGVDKGNYLIEISQGEHKEIKNIMVL